MPQKIQVPVDGNGRGARGGAGRGGGRGAGGRDKDLLCEIGICNYMQGGKRAGEREAG